MPNQQNPSKESCTYFSCINRATSFSYQSVIHLFLDIDKKSIHSVVSDILNFHWMCRSFSSTFICFKLGWVDQLPARDKLIFTPGGMIQLAKTQVPSVVGPSSFSFSVILLVERQVKVYRQWVHVNGVRGLHWSFLQKGTSVKSLEIVRNSGTLKISSIRTMEIWLPLCSSMMERRSHYVQATT